MLAGEDVINAWERHLRARGQWRADMRAILAASREDLPSPALVGREFVDLRPDRPFAADEFPTPTRWLWEADDAVDEDLFDRTRRDGFIPLRDLGCGEYDVLVITASQAGRVWALADVGAALVPDEQISERRAIQVGWR